MLYSDLILCLQKNIFKITYCDPIKKIINYYVSSKKNSYYIDINILDYYFILRFSYKKNTNNEAQRVVADNGDDEPTEDEDEEISPGIYKIFKIEHIKIEEDETETVIRKYENLLEIADDIKEMEITFKKTFKYDIPDINELLSFLLKKLHNSYFFIKDLITEEHITSTPDKPFNNTIIIENVDELINYNNYKYDFHICGLTNLNDCNNLYYYIGDFIVDYLEDKKLLFSIVYINYSFFGIIKDNKLFYRNNLEKSNAYDDKLYPLFEVSKNIINQLQKLSYIIKKERKDILKREINDCEYELNKNNYICQELYGNNTEKFLDFFLKEKKNNDNKENILELFKNYEKFEKIKLSTYKEDNLLSFEKFNIDFLKKNIKSTFIEKFSQIITEFEDILGIEYNKRLANKSNNTNNYYNYMVDAHGSIIETEKFKIPLNVRLILQCQLSYGTLSQIENTVSSVPFKTNLSNLQMLSIPEYSLVKFKKKVKNFYYEPGDKQIRYIKSKDTLKCVYSGNLNELRKITNFPHPTPTVHKMRQEKKEIFINDMYLSGGSANDEILNIDFLLLKIPLKPIFKFKKNIFNPNTTILIQRYNLFKYFIYPLLKYFEKNQKLPFGYKPENMKLCAVCKSHIYNNITYNITKCANCNKNSYNNKLKKCSSCKLVKYCDRTCQAKHWSTHFKECHVDCKLCKKYWCYNHKDKKKEHDLIFHKDECNKSAHEAEEKEDEDEDEEKKEKLIKTYPKEIHYRLKFINILYSNFTFKKTLNYDKYPFIYSENELNGNQMPVKIPEDKMKLSTLVNKLVEKHNIKSNNNKILTIYFLACRAYESTQKTWNYDNQIQLLDYANNQLGTKFLEDSILPPLLINQKKHKKKLFPDMPDSMSYADIDLYFTNYLSSIKKLGSLKYTIESTGYDITHFEYTEDDGYKIVFQDAFKNYSITLKNLEKLKNLTLKKHDLKELKNKGVGGARRKSKKIRKSQRRIKSLRKSQRRIKSLRKSQRRIKSLRKLQRKITKTRKNKKK